MRPEAILTEFASMLRAKSPAEVIDEIADVYVFRETGPARAVNFQLSLIVLGARAARACGAAIPPVAEELETLLADLTANRPFTYFDMDAPLPADLDTAAAVVSAVRAEPTLRAYDAVVERNRRADGTVPTWLDVAEQHVRFPIVPGAVHPDVFLSHWVAMQRIGRPVSYRALVSAAHAGLTPYWYYSPFYATYLLAHIVAVSEWQGDAMLRDRILAELDPSVSNRSAHPVPQVEATRRAGRTAATDRFLAGAALSLLFATGTVPDVDPEMVDEPLYWTVGFQPYANRLVMLALIATVVAAVTQQTRRA